MKLRKEREGEREREREGERDRGRKRERGVFESARNAYIDYAVQTKLCKCESN